jgi:MFS family permease
MTAAPGRRAWTAPALLATAQLMFVLNVTVVKRGPARHRHVPETARAVLPWVMTAYTAVFGAPMLLGGRVADLLGPRTMTLAAWWCSPALRCYGTLSGSGTILLAGRGAQGLWAPR